MLRQVLGIGALLLFAVTWRLWTPQHLFPRVPLFAAVAEWSPLLVATANWIVLVVWIISAAAMVLPRLSQRWQRAVALLFCAGLVALTVLDQHRLQPWGVHIAICFLLLAFSSGQRRVGYLTAFTVSLYIYSAVGKFDAQFLHTVGQEFLGSLWRLLGMDAGTLSARSRFWLAALFPIVELVCGLGLAFRPTRRATAVAAIVMHGTLLCVLGPWGLGHAWGVHLWNALFIAIDCLIFIFPQYVDRPISFVTRADVTAVADTSTAEQSDLARPTSHVTNRIGVAEVVLVLAISLPLGERFGLVDHWLGWALYAPHSSRAHVQVSAAAVERLPQIIQPFVEVSTESQLLWCDVYVNRWSLETLNVPVYPQQRFYIGVARALSARLESFEIRVEALGVADRWSGRRHHLPLSSQKELQAAGERYWFNTRPDFDAQ